MRHARRLAAVVALFGALVPGACVIGTETGNPPSRGSCPHTCGACAPPITLHVRSEDPTRAGGGVAVDGDSALCFMQADYSECLVWTPDPTYSEPGSYELTVTAPGHEPQTVSVNVPASSGGCCDCGYEPVMVDVTLVPE